MGPCNTEACQVQPDSTESLRRSEEQILHDGLYRMSFSYHPFNSQQHKTLPNAGNNLPNAGNNLV